MFDFDLPDPGLYRTTQPMPGNADAIPAGALVFIGQPKTGGVKGGLGLAEDPSHASLSCHQIGPITLPAKLKAGEEVFDVSTSLVFKEQKVVRFYDEKRNALVYLTYSTKLVDGSYKSAVSAVPIMPWG